MSKDQDVLDALQSQLQTYFANPVNWSGGAVYFEPRNTAVPAEIGAGGTVIIRDGEFEREQDTGDDSQPSFYTHTAEIEVYVEDADAAARNAKYGALAAAIGAALAADMTLGGEIKGAQRPDRPAPKTVAVEGSADIKCGIIRFIMDYETTAPLA